MLPTEDAIWVGEEMTRRFGLPSWQFALTATDANRFTIRLARAATGRSKVLVHNWCYHGSVDETFAVLTDDGIALAPAQHRRPRRPEPDDAGRRDQRPRRARARAGGGRRRLLPLRACAHQHRDRASRPRLSRGRPRADPPPRDVPRDRRDPHALRRPGRLHPRARPRPRLPDGRKAARERRTGGRVRDVGGDGPPRRRRASDRAGRRRRHRRHAGRERTLAASHARHARARPHRRGLRAHDPAGRAVHRRRRGGDRAAGRSTGTSPGSAAGRSTASSPSGPAPGARPPRRWITTSTGSCTSTR